MESNRKRRGFMKGKLMPFYRASKPSTTVQYNTKVKPSQSSPSPSSVGYLVHQDYVFAQPKQKVSFIIPDSVAGDDSVDLKAAIYISSVQERFKAERMINSDYQDMHAQ